MKQYLLSILCFFFLTLLLGQDQSAARKWNEEVLYAISADFARPTVHARNLFHTSIAMYDSWMVYKPNGNTYLLGKTLGEYESSFKGIELPDDISAARDETISFAVYRIIEHRYSQSPGIIAIADSINSLMDSFGYNRFNTSTDYVNGGPAELGNYIAQQIIEFGYTDGSNELGDYENQYYLPVNPPIEVEEPGNPEIIFPNRWQQISLSESIDQSGEIVENAPPFLSPEWGNVLPFAMTNEDLTIKNRDGNDYKIYHDPGDPAYIDTTDPSGLESFYKWNFALVPIWQSHLDISDNVVWDISPNAVGNIQSYPETEEEYQSFYNFFDGGDPSQGYDINPVTGQPYEPQMINRADYARVLAEFWADGPESVTPPGHWFKIYNEVSDHPLFKRKWKGIGEDLDNLEYDVKAYFTIGGAMHDAAIAAWSIKGFYDYLRPVSAVRFMADRGQCTDPGLPNYHRAGLPLIPGYIELVEIGDPLAGLANQHAGKIKLYTWRGPDYIENPATDEAGVGWILAENWWPYQRPSFVTPPFAGYVSGHSTYSRTAAEVLTLMTGSEYFPGGMSGFVVEQNEFLVFEEGPSESFQLQWAKYYDASDQCSLSRIWGGIHPPVDDIPGRKIGMELGPEVFNYSDSHLLEERPFVSSSFYEFENINEESIGQSFSMTFTFDQIMDQSVNPQLAFEEDDILNSLSISDSYWSEDNEFVFVFTVLDNEIEGISSSLSLSGAVSLSGSLQNPYFDVNPITVDTKKPDLVQLSLSTQLINDDVVENQNLTVQFTFSENCQMESNPTIVISGDGDLESSLTFSETLSSWSSETIFDAVYELTDADIEVGNIEFEVSNYSDFNDNDGNAELVLSDLIIDTSNPSINLIQISDENINIQDIGTSDFNILIEFNDAMNTDIDPELEFSDENVIGNILEPIEISSNWTSEFACQITYSIENVIIESENIDLILSSFKDSNQNSLVDVTLEDMLTIDTKRPAVMGVETESDVVSDNFLDSGFGIEVIFSEPMDMSQDALVVLFAENVDDSFDNDFLESQWLNENTYLAQFQVSDQNIEIEGIGVSVQFGLDNNGNSQDEYEMDNVIALDTKNPQIISLGSSDYYIDINDVGENAFEFIMVFDESMDEELAPEITFNPSTVVSDIISVNESESEWINQFTYKMTFDVAESDDFIPGIDITIDNAFDAVSNNMIPVNQEGFFTIDMQSLGIADDFDTERFKVYPNILESGQSLNFKSETSLTGFSFVLTNISGTEVFSTIQDLNQGETRLDLPKLASGIYMYQIIADDLKRMHGKIVISR